MFNRKMITGSRLKALAAAAIMTGALTGCNTASQNNEPVVYRGDTSVTGFNHFAAADAVGNRIFFQEAAGYQLVYGHERPDVTTRLARGPETHFLMETESIATVPTDD